MKKNQLFFSFILIVLCVGAFAAMGYYYLTYRNAIMQEAVEKSGTMSIRMFRENMEKDFFSEENKMLLDIAFTGAKNISNGDLVALRRRHPIIDRIFFLHTTNSTHVNNDSPENMEDWLVGKVESTVSRRPIEPFALRHFSGRYNDQPVQAGFLPLPHASAGGKTDYLIFTFDQDYIRNKMFPEQVRLFDGILPAVKIVEKSIGLDSDGASKNMLFVDMPFHEIFPFWKIIATVDLSGTKKRARMEFIVYSGIIFFVFLLIVLSIYFIWQQMQQERKLSQLKSQIIFHGSHELKTPLSLIRMYAETMMLGRIKHPSKMQEYYRIILSECDRLHLLINNTLEFSNIEKEIKEYDFTKGDIVATLQQIMASYNYYLKQKGFTLHTDIDPDIPSFLFDRVAMTQIIVNLLDNAIKFSPEKKKIHLSLRRDAGGLILEVTDHGIGMKPEALQYIFLPYYRLSKRFRGSGIGLSLVKHAVEAHNGTIRVQSEPGKGTTFSLLFPLAHERSE
ncbi:MAG TPA: HAMP domain-containing histidine kinase [Desulfobulbus sp.]|nr:HAMP domain-containing histidine kinase [Desulfobulbus sp.]